MPAFTLYGSCGSTNTDRVRLTLAEGGYTDYELVLLHLQQGEQKVGKPVSLEDDLALPCVTPQDFSSLLAHFLFLSSV